MLAALILIVFLGVTSPREVVRNSLGFLLDDSGDEEDGMMMMDEELDEENNLVFPPF